MQPTPPEQTPVQLPHREAAQQFLDVDAVEIDTGPLPSVMSRVAALQSSDSTPKLPTHAWHESIPKPLPSSSFVEDAGPGLTMLTDARITTSYEVSLFHPSVWICQRCNTAYPPHALREI
eukprot:1689295-Karenia_brevis.AAC.1